MLRIYQGESRMVMDNELLGTFVFSGIRPAPKGTVRVEVFFYIDSEGILNLSARDEETGHSVTTTLKVGKRKDTQRPEPPKPRQQDAVDTLDTAAARAAAPAPTIAPLQMPASSLAREISGTPGEPAAPREAAARPERTSTPPEAATQPEAEARPHRPPGERPIRRHHRHGPPREGAPREHRPLPGDPDRPRVPGAKRKKRRPPNLDQPRPPLGPPRLEPRPAPEDATFMKRVSGWFKRLFGK